MTPIENLYYAFGELMYAMVISDGRIQKEEREKIDSLMQNEFRKHPEGIIIYKLLKKDKRDLKTAYDWAIHQLKLNSQYVNDTLKVSFMKIITEVAQAAPPVTSEEQGLLNDFQSELNKIKGDPVFNKYTV